MNNEQQNQTNISNTNQTVHTNSDPVNTNPGAVNVNTTEQNVSSASSSSIESSATAQSTTNHVESSSLGPASSNRDFSGVVDPSKITVGPEAIHPQIPVNEPTKANVTASSNHPNPNEPKKNTFSLILVFILFVGVGAFIWFMPEIREMLNNNKEDLDQSNVSEENKTPQKEQTESFDTMICSQISTTYTFYSQEEKLKKYSISEEFTTDIDNNYDSCLLLQQSEVNGFVVGCEKTTNRVERVRTYDLEVLPDTFTNEKDFNLDEDINTIKEELQGQNYTCS